MKAKDFEFDGKRLHEFGMILCRFGSSGLEIVDGVQVSFNTVSTLNGAKNELVSTQYENCLETTLQICKHSCTGGVREITSTEYRQLTKWLCRKKFLKLKILDDANIDLYHEVAINISKIELDGKLYGLELKVVTNRPFALKEPKTILIENTGEQEEIHTWKKYKVLRDYEIAKKEVGTTQPEDCLSSTYTDYKIADNGEFELSGTSYLSGYHYISGTKKSIYYQYIKNVSSNITYGYQLWTLSDVPIDVKGEIIGSVSSNDKNAYPNDGIQGGYWYVYSKSEIEYKKIFINDISHEEGYIYPHTEITIAEDGDLNIYNAIEDRDTYIANCVAGEIITMDYPVIQSSVSSHNIQNDFNWNFFRVANTFDNSRNDLTISIPCTIKLEYSPIVKVGF